MLARCEVRADRLMHADCDSSGSCLEFVDIPTFVGWQGDGEIRVFVRRPFSESIAIIQPNGDQCQRST
jgi:hypothetical protein